ncbi:MAG: P1 family peptidase [Lachnospiraceae bacterium]|nr:P1 family peptidase [Lachnospiraceae bacterium]
MKKRIREYGILIGTHETGALNKITDVPGVTVGHYTVDTDEHKTGVTVIMPCEDNMFANKLTAAAFVHNGYGKTAGIPQIEELGTLETPIALTNTLNVGRVQDALVEYMVTRCEREGVKVTSINTVVGECNDASLNKITERVIGTKEVFEAIESAKTDFEEGDVGAGKGTTCFGMKGGIGSASRLVKIGDETYTIGVLVQSNFGKTKNFVLNGKPMGTFLLERMEEAKKDEGSIMMVIGTDLPVSDRQLKRIIKRAGVGLSRCGSYMGHGSGDIMLGFSTGNRYGYQEEAGVVAVKQLNENMIDEVFEAVGEATEEAVLNSLSMAETVRGYEGNVRYSLTDLYLKEL